MEFIKFLLYYILALFIFLVINLLIIIYKEQRKKNAKG